MSAVSFPAFSEDDTKYINSFCKKVKKTIPAKPMDISQMFEHYMSEEFQEKFRQKFIKDLPMMAVGWGLNSAIGKCLVYIERNYIKTPMNSKAHWVLTHVITYSGSRIIFSITALFKANKHVKITQKVLTLTNSEVSTKADKTSTPYQKVYANLETMAGIQKDYNDAKLTESKLDLLATTVVFVSSTALFLSRLDKSETVKKGFIIFGGVGLVASFGISYIKDLLGKDPRNEAQFAKLKTCIGEITGHIETNPQWNALKSPS